ncbi:MAG: hypothetical protein V4506_13865 [Bacteroidota bacterium]
MKSQIIFKTMLGTALFLCLLSGFNAQAQSSAKEFYHTPYNSRNSGSYGKGDHYLSLGYGVPNWLYSGYGISNSIVYGSPNHFGIGPMMLKYEVPIRDEVGLGVIFQGAMKNWKYSSGGRTYHDKAWGTGAAFMGYYHFNKLINVPKLDVYAGLGINFTYQKLTRDVGYYNYYYNYYGYYYNDRVEDEFEVRPCGVVGVRYYVAPKFAFSAEAGYTTFSSLNLGFTFRL